MFMNQFSPMLRSRSKPAIFTFLISVIVFSVPWMAMRKYMLVAHKIGMTRGDFAFICINGDVRHL